MPEAAPKKRGRPRKIRPGEPGYGETPPPKVTKPRKAAAEDDEEDVLAPTRGFSLRLPEELHQRLAQAAHEIGAPSSAQLVRVAIAHFLEVPEHYVVVSEVSMEIRAVKRALFARMASRFGEFAETEARAFFDDYVAASQEE